MLLLSDSSVDDLLTLSGIVDSDLLSLSHNVCFSLFSLSHAGLMMICCPFQKVLMTMHSHFQAVLYTHDKIACGDYEPHIDPIPVEDEEDEAAIKIVSIIKKHNEPLVGVSA